MHCKKTFATFLCQNSGTILIITYVFCYQSNFLIFAGGAQQGSPHQNHISKKVPSLCRRFKKVPSLQDRKSLEDSTKPLAPQCRADPPGAVQNQRLARRQLYSILKVSPDF